MRATEAWRERRAPTQSLEQGESVRLLQERIGQVDLRDFLLGRAIGTAHANDVQKGSRSRMPDNGGQIVTQK